MCKVDSASVKPLKVNTLTVKRSHLLAAGIREIIVERPEVCPEILPGQFYNLGVKQAGGPILKRPISVSRISEEGIHFVIKLLGEGTKRLDELRAGQDLLAVGPLGNGVKEDQWCHVNNLVLIGGGIGTAPLLELAIKAKAKNKKVISILGFSETPYLIETFSHYSDELYICESEAVAKSRASGHEAATHVIGTVKDGLNAARLESDKLETVVFACGPEVMLHAIQIDVQDISKDAYYMTEERMACGMGACLVCAKKVKQDDEIKMLRTCVEGPVFRAEEVIFE